MNSGTSLQLTNCALKGNITRYRFHGSSGFGGGIANFGHHATLTNCTLSGNRAHYGGGGGIFNTAMVTLTNCTFRDNRSASRVGDSGGGILSTGTTTLTNSTLSGNSARLGGGIQNLGGTATLTNCTLSGNRSRFGGGGIWNAGGTASVTLLNSIVANSKLGNCAGPLTSGGHNLDSDGTCFSAGGSDLLNSAPVVAPLANYGGPTESVALCTAPGVPHPSCTAASPAIDAGDDAVTGPPNNLTTDQRELPRLSGAHVDIGAYEVQ